jgi:hypothetical protein
MSLEWWMWSGNQAQRPSFPWYEPNRAHRVTYHPFSVRTSKMRAMGVELFITVLPRLLGKPQLFFENSLSGVRLHSTLCAPGHHLSHKPLDLLLVTLLKDVLYHVRLLVQ